jgi:hypothetical protein
MSEYSDEQVYVSSMATPGSDVFFYNPSVQVQAPAVVHSYGITTPGSVSRQVVRESGNVSSGPINLTEPDIEINRTLSDSNIGAANRILQDVLTSGSVSSSVQYEASGLSQVEAAILRASIPFEINESEVITVNGQSGVWSNKNEIINWKGVIPLSQYVINEDVNPEIIRKRTEQQLTYEQEIAVRYLRPPTPPPPGEILIRQEKNLLTPPAPPLVIRQQPPRPETPPPLIVREAPPNPPAAIGQKVITISGKRIPPPPRKVVIERLAPLPVKPQSIIVERWLPYRDQKRRVIFQRNTVADPVIAVPRNVIVQWEAPQVVIKKEFKDLGVIRANPAEYVERYGASLKAHIDLPQFVKDIPAPSGVVLAAQYVPASILELEGDVQALSLIDLESEGLAAYRHYIRSSSLSVGHVSAGSTEQLNLVIAELFASVDRNGDGSLSLSEAESLLLKLNSRLGRQYGEDQARAFFKALDSNNDGSISFEEFRRAIIRSFSH